MAPNNRKDRKAYKRKEEEMAKKSKELEDATIEEGTKDNKSAQANNKTSKEQIMKHGNDKDEDVKPKKKEQKAGAKGKKDRDAKPEKGQEKAKTKGEICGKLKDKDVKTEEAKAKPVIIRFPLHMNNLLSSYSKIMRVCPQRIREILQREQRHLSKEERMPIEILWTLETGILLIDMIDDPTKEQNENVVLLFNLVNLYFDSFWVNGVWYRLSDATAELPPKSELPYDDIVILDALSSYQGLGGRGKVGPEAFNHCFHTFSKAGDLLKKDGGLAVLKNGPLSLPAVVFSEALRFLPAQLFVKSTLISGDSDIPRSIERYFNKWDTLSGIIDGTTAVGLFGLSLLAVKGVVLIAKRTKCGTKATAQQNSTGHEQEPDIIKHSEQTNLQNEKGNRIRPDFTHTAAGNPMAEMFQGEELGSSSGTKSTPGISVSDVLTQMEQLEEMEFQEALAASMAEDEGAGGIQRRTETLIIHHAQDAENITQMVQDKNLVQMLGSEIDSPCVSSSSSSTCIPETLASIEHHVQESMVHNEMRKGMSTEFAKLQQIEEDRIFAATLEKELEGRSKFAGKFAASSSSGTKSTSGFSVSEVVTQMKQLEEMELQKALAASMAEDEGAGGIQRRTETLIIHHAQNAENITQMVQDKNLVQMLGSEIASPCVRSSSSSTCIPETLASIEHHVQEPMVHNEMRKGMSTDFAKLQQIEEDRIFAATLEKELEGRRKSGN